MTTERLLRDHQQGDEEAADLIFRRVLPELYRFARSRIPPWAKRSKSTSDYVQDALLAVYPKLDGIELKSPGALRAYLKTALLNRMRDELRSLKTRGTRVPVDEQLIAKEHGPQRVAIIRQEYDHYLAALNGLDDASRELIDARMHNACSYSQIALMTDRPTADSARKAVKRALAKLRRALQDDGNSSSQA